jgi:phospholipase/carboxylesterase
MTALLSHSVIEPQERAQASVIWIHGLGGQGKNFRPLLSQVKLNFPVRFVLPNAGKMHITLKDNQLMPAWYNVSEISGNHRHIDTAGFNQSVSQLQKIVEHEIALVGADKVILAGFSQGGAMALHLGLTAQQPLAGVLAISTYLPQGDNIAYKIQPHAKQTPLCIMHGKNDDIVPFSLGKQVYDFLHMHGFTLEWHAYDTAHMINSAQLKDITSWINNTLK